MDMITYFIAIILILLLYIYYKCTKHYNYWEKQKVPYKKPTFFFGNYGQYIRMKEHIGETTKKLCEAFPSSPYVGAYFGLEPTLIVQDPDVLKVIMTKDFYYFSSREVEEYTHRELATRSIFFIGGDNWRVTRQAMTPIFSSAKMKNMFYLVRNCAHVFENLIEDEFKVNKVFDIKDLTGRFTMDCLSSCVYGVETKAMSSDPNNVFRIIAESMLGVSNIRGLSLIGRTVYPGIFYGLGFKVFPEQIKNFFFKLVKDIFEVRNYKDSGRNDFVDLLLNLKKQDFVTGDSITNYKGQENKKVSLKVDDDFLTIQCMTLFGAGFDTSAAAFGFTLYELAKNKEAQKRAIEEIDEYLKTHNNTLEYDCITKLPYLDACVDEVLRLYPVLVVLTREVVENYKLNGVELEKGVRVHIPVYHLHRRADLFPEPDKYQPERFLPENRHLIRSYSYLPFGVGPRICIGMRFAKMQVLSGLITILKRFTFELADDMPTSITIEPRSIASHAIGGIRLKARARSDAEDRKFA